MNFMENKGKAWASAGSQGSRTPRVKQQHHTPRSWLRVKQSLPNNPQVEAALMQSSLAFLWEKNGNCPTGKRKKLSTRSTSTKHKEVERSKAWLLFSVSKFKTFLSSHTCTSKHHPSNHSRWESGTDHRAWNWSQQPFQVRVWNPSESEINHSHYSRWVWNHHLCWQTPPSPQTEKSSFKTQKPWTTPQETSATTEFWLHLPSKP